MSIISDVKLSVKQNQLTLEDLITMGIELRAKRDNVNWALGDLAVEVTNTMGIKMMRQVAVGIGIKINTFRRYADVSRAYPDQKLRDEFAQLSWSHFRLLSGRDDRHLWLVRAIDEQMTIERLKVLISPDKAKIIDDGGFVPPKPEMGFCLKTRRWYIMFKNETCAPGCDHKELKIEVKAEESDE